MLFCVLNKPFTRQMFPEYFLYTYINCLYKVKEFRLFFHAGQLFTFSMEFKSEALQGLTHSHGTRQDRRRRMAGERIKYPMPQKPPWSSVSWIVLHRIGKSGREVMSDSRFRDFLNIVVFTLGIDGRDVIPLCSVVPDGSIYYQL